MNEDLKPPIIAEVVNLAPELRKWYIAMKKDFIGKPYKPHPRFDTIKIWQAAAEKCLDLKADPFSFMRAGFIYSGMPKGPFPTHYASNAAVRWYQTYSRMYSKDGKAPEDVYAAEIKALIGDAAMQLHTQRITNFRDYLLDEHFCRLDVIPAFVRIILMPSEPAVFHKWSRKAYQEIMSNPRLLDVLQGKLGYDLQWLRQAPNATIG